MFNYKESTLVQCIFCKANYLVITWNGRAELLDVQSREDMCDTIVCLLEH